MLDLGHHEGKSGSMEAGCNPRGEVTGTPDEDEHVFEHGYSSAAVQPRIPDLPQNVNAVLAWA
jgi:hypothetical protein